MTDPENGREDDTFAEVLNRFTFDSGRGRRSRRRAREHDSRHEEESSRDAASADPRSAPPYDSLEPPADFTPATPEFADPGHFDAGYTSSRHDAAAFGDRGSEAWFAGTERAAPVDNPGFDLPAEDPHVPSEPAESQAANIRPYAWTGGRTRSDQELELETLVSTSDTYRPGPGVRVEHQSVAELCRHPRSVAEIGALLGVPLGVAKVLLADMTELGFVVVHRTVTEGGSTPHMMLMERVLSGLRRL